MRWVSLFFLVLALGLSACGDDDDEPASAGETQAAPAATEEAPAPAETETAPAEPSGGASGATAKITGATNLKEKPGIEIPDADPPSELVKRDLVKGKGATAKSGDTVSMQYVGNSWTNKGQFDASWDRGGEPFQFQLGAGMVIQGWDEGIVGMKEGGRRVLTIPPDLAYGPQAPSPDIAPNDTLVFVVDLEKVGSG